MSYLRASYEFADLIVGLVVAKNALDTAIFALGQLHQHFGEGIKLKSSEPVEKAIDFGPFWCTIIFLFD